MELFGIGPMELILILIVAMMVFGPERLPTIGAKLGRTMRDMRRATRAISEEINTTRAAIEGPAKELTGPFQDIADAAKAASSVAAAARNPGEAIRQSVLKELNAPAKAEKAAPTPVETENTIAPPFTSDETPVETGAAVTALEDASAPSDAAPSLSVDVPFGATGPSEPPAALYRITPEFDGSKPPAHSGDAEPNVTEQ
jgi:TatA/E family protein of Tat protein translocase